MIRTNRPIASSLVATTDFAIKGSNIKTYFALVDGTIPPARWIPFECELNRWRQHRNVSAIDDLGCSRRGGYPRKFDREDAAFTRQVAGMNVAAECLNGAGDDGQ